MPAGAGSAGAYHSRGGNGDYREADADLPSPAGKAEHSNYAVHQRDARDESLQYDGRELPGLCGCGRRIQCVLETLHQKSGIYLRPVCGIG